jgi:hypothetical protein
VQIARNLAVRWDQAAPSVGVDPDVSVLSPRPPVPAAAEPDGVGNLRSVLTWVPGHAPPRLAIEVVSETNPSKDYAVAPDKYAASGTEELVVFDPHLAGPRTHGGPHRLQVWRRMDDGFVRVYAGSGPSWSSVLGAHLVVVSAGRRLRIGATPDERQLWPTGEEAERAAKDAAEAAKDAAEAAKDAAEAAKDAAEARIRELEARLSREPQGR